MEPLYRVELGTILNELGDQIMLDVEMSLEPFTVGTETFSPVSPAHVHISLTNTGAGVVAQGTITVDLTATCCRCLGDFVLQSVGDVEGFYVTPSHAKQLPEEQEYEFIHDHAIDLMPALLAAMTVDLPFAPLHDPECAGICPTCGADRNVDPCDCLEEADGSPFAALGDLFHTEDGE
ncbi:MAG: DUF177 domain-containing protein [Coriobacteriia bacterium]|nr:DUF177 domain-containing protein [Coriobacteriia bacterium]